MDSLDIATPHNGELTKLQDTATGDLIDELVARGKELVRQEVAHAKQVVAEDIGLLKSIGTDGKDALVAGGHRVEGQLRALAADLGEDGRQARRAARPLLAGSVLINASVNVLLFALIAGLATLVSIWVAALAVGIVVAVAGAIVTRIGTARAEHMLADPFQQTKHALKENKTWVTKTMAGLARRIRITGQMMGSGWSRSPKS